MSEVSYSVPGVSCDHCRRAIASEVQGVAGVESVEVDLDRKVVLVRGEAFVDDDVRAAIDEAGYEVEGPPA